MIRSLPLRHLLTRHLKLVRLNLQPQAGVSSTLASLTSVDGGTRQRQCLPSSTTSAGLEPSHQTQLQTAILQLVSLSSWRHSIKDERPCSLDRDKSRLARSEDWYYEIRQLECRLYKHLVHDHCCPGPEPTPPPYRYRRTRCAPFVLHLRKSLHHAVRDEPGLWQCINDAS